MAVPAPLTLLSFFANDGLWTLSAIVVTAITACAGHAHGRKQGFALRLQAQSALCHVATEENTQAFVRALEKAQEPVG